MSTASPIMVPCRCCGRPLVDQLGLEEVMVAAALTPAQTAILRAIAKKNGQWVTTVRVADIVYASDPDGGPDDALNCIKVQVNRIRKRLAKAAQSLRLEGSSAGAFRLVAGIETRKNGWDRGEYRWRQP